MYWLDGSSELQIYLSMTIVKATVRIWNPWGLCNKKWWKCLGLLLYKWKRKKILFWQIEAGFIRYTRRAKNILSNLDYFALSYWLLQIFHSHFLHNYFYARSTFDMPTYCTFKGEQDAKKNWVRDTKHSLDSFTTKISEFWIIFFARIFRFYLVIASLHLLSPSFKTIQPHEHNSRSQIDSIHQFNYNI